MHEEIEQAETRGRLAEPCCAAPTAEQLRELVEAADLCSGQLALVSDSNQTFLVRARLDSALEPFRKALTP